MAIAWLAFPAVLAVLALGCGLLVERLAPAEMSGGLVLPLGLAAMIVIAQLFMLWPAVAMLATPAVVVAAVGGLATTRRPRAWPKIDGWGLAAVLGVFAVFAAPVVLSGQATFAGFIKLDDTAIWLAQLDRLMSHGRDIAGLAPSSYQRTLQFFLASGYPIGSFLPLGVGRALTGQDAAWVFQPYLTFLAATLASALWSLVGGVVRGARARALAAFIGAQPALLYGYAMWGGTKELAAAPLIAVTAALLPLTAGARSWRLVIPIAVTSAATLSVLGFGGAVWLIPLLAPAAVMLVRRRRRRLALRELVAFVAGLAVLSVPLITAAGPIYRATRNAIEDTSALGNLIKPLSDLQLAGVWISGDFRTDPAHRAVTYVLIGIVIVAAVAGLVVAWTRRAWELPLYLLSALVGAFAVTVFGSPWVGGKALATAAPAVLVAGVVGTQILWERKSGRGLVRWFGAAAAAAIAFGVLWSNVLQYHDVWLAPRGQLVELQKIGERFAGQGPTLMTEFEPFGVRHFLRKSDAEGASELRARLIPLVGGGLLPKGESADIDRFQLAGVLVYRTLVLRRSPVASRPPAPYRLALQDDFYEAWQRSEPLRHTVIQHVALGNALQPGAKPTCAQVAAVARVARQQGGVVATVVRRPVVTAPLADFSRPQAWVWDGKDPNTVYPHTSGSMAVELNVPFSGEYQVWIGGAFRGRLTISVDGKTTATERNKLNERGEFEPMGTASLVAGVHSVKIDYSAGGLAPGSGGPPFALGPLALAQGTADQPVRYFSPAHAGRLCTHRLDWLEAVRR